MKFKDRIKEAKRQIVNLSDQAGVACKINDIEVNDLNVAEGDDTKGTALIIAQIDVGTLGNSMRASVAFSVDELGIKIIYTEYMHHIEFTLDNLHMAIGHSVCFA